MIDPDINEGPCVDCGASYYGDHECPIDGPDMTYADICLERAESADPGTTWQWVFNKELPHNSEFIHHARKDIIELSRRLKLACELLRQISHDEGDLFYKEFAEDLETLPEATFEADR